MTDRELMQQALEALEFHVKNADEIEEIDLALVTALRERLAQPEQDPVVKWDASAPLVVHPHPAFQSTPPQRQWQGLTDEEIWELMCRNVLETDLCRAVEAKLKEKNT